jgi:CRP-like cAMP-binding protein
MASLPLVSPLDRALFLKAQPYLAGLPSSTLAALAEHSDEREFQAGESIYRADESPRAIHFLSAGAVRIQYASVAPFDLEAPAGLGLMDHLARPEVLPDVSALRETQTLCLGLDAMMQILEDDFLLQLAIARSLSQIIVASQRALGARRPREPGFPSDRRPATPDRLDLVERLVWARSSPFFQDSSLTVLTELFRFQGPRAIAAGETLWRRGEPVESMALVLDGRFAGLCGAHEHEIPAGAMPGAWELFSLAPRRETVRAETSGWVVEIDRTHFTDVLEDHFEFTLDYLGKAAREVLALRSLGAPPPEERCGPAPEEPSGPAAEASG